MTKHERYQGETHIHVEILMKFSDIPAKILDSMSCPISQGCCCLLYLHAHKKEMFSQDANFKELVHYNN